MNGRKDRVEAIFQAAMELNSPEEREAYLLSECGEDAELRREVKELLRAAVQAEEVFETRAHPPALEQVGSRIGHYHLLQKIGEGGCGVVYMAEQEAPVRRKVALKIVKLGMDTRQVIARFEAERQALALMDHPNIAKVLDAGATETGRPYFVMELVRGTKITNYCDEQKLSMDQRLNLFIQVCQAVQHAHQKGVIHRDLKPSNILVTERDGVPVPKVIDFGIAKATGDLQLTDKTLFTAFEQFVGTPAYMSPEQARLGELDIDTRSDIYSLGVLLYELLTGQPPFEAVELKRLAIDEVLRAVREQDPPLPSNRLTAMTEAKRTTVARCRQVDPSVLPKILSGDLDWIVMKCLEKDRTRRYETANGLALDVQHFLKHEPVTAAAPSARYRMRKFVQRNQTIVIAATTLVLTLLAGITTSTWLAVLATGARDKAMTARNNEAKANQQLKQQVFETEQARRETAEALQRMQIQKAEELLSTHQTHLGVAYLGRVLRANPSNRVAADRLVSALLHRRFPRQLTEPFCHEDVLNSAQFSPDGQRVVTASRDKAARVWDARTGQPLTEPLRHEGEVWSAQFSPDGQGVVTASNDKTARVWDARTGQPLTAPLRHEAEVVSAQFSPDGQRVVTASNDTTARVWDALTGQPLTEPLRHESYVVSAQFSPDGQRVVTASNDKTARVWDARTGQPITEPLRHESYVSSAQFSPDGQRVVTASWDKTARVWDARTGQPLTAPLRHEAEVVSAQFSPDGQRVVTASNDRTARVWDARTGQPIAEPLRHENGVMCAQFSPDGQQVVTASNDKTARVWDGRTGQLLTEPLRHESYVVSAQFSPDGQRVVTASRDKTARVWDARTGQPVSDPLRHENWVVSAQFSLDGLRVVTASWDGTAQVWEYGAAIVPVPGWFVDWAEAEGGRRFNSQGTDVAVSTQKRQERRQQVTARTDTNFFSVLAKWVQADAGTRSISPNSSITVAEWVNHRIHENTLASLREATQISPTNSEAFARLATLLKDQDYNENPRHVEEAEFYARFALKWDPNNGEALQIIRAIQLLKGLPTDPRQSSPRR